MQLKRAPWPLRIAVVVVLALFLIGLIVGLAQVFGIRSLPSETWAMRARPYAIGLGTAEGASLTLLTWLGFRVQGEAKSLVAWLALPVSALMGFWLMSDLVYTGPALIGSAGQKAVSHAYSVSEVPRSSDRRCPKAVRLWGLPSMSDRVCGVPDDIRAGLASGMRVEVIGTGNAFGLRPAQIRILR